MTEAKTLDVVAGGVVIQVSTQQGDHVAEALTFVPEVTVEGIKRGYEIPA